MKSFLSNTALLLFILPPSFVASFCYHSGIQRETINVDIQSRPKPSPDWPNQWELVANVTWQKLQNDNEFGGYAVRAALNQATELLKSNNCSLAGLIETEEESYLFTGLLFGYDYFFGVSIIEASTHQRGSTESYKVKKSPDCYLETSNIEFCMAQSVEISGVPMDFQIDCAAPSSTNEAGDNLYTAILSWTPPIQVAGNITAYELRYGKSSPDVALNIKTTEDKMVYIQQLNGLLELSNYTATVRAFVNGKGGPKAFLQFSTEDKLLSNNLTRRNGKCQELVRIPDGTTFPANTTPKTPESRVAVVVGSILAVFVVGGALMLRVAKKRRRTLADSKEAIFVRYPEDDGCIKETSCRDGAFDELRGPDVNFQGKEVDRSLLTINEKIGSGQFGIVYSGVLSPRDNMHKKYAPRPVAVKSLKLNATRETKEDFLDEIKLIIDIGYNPNILPILGCCTVDEPYYLIMEFMKYGDLLGFLWKCREERYQAQDPMYCLTETGQLQIARQISRGMEYLSNTRYYHGDLAARNMLVGEGLVVKISDFGMADDIYQRGYKRIGQEKKRPLKWVSLETNTKGTCSIKSDVWSFGIVLYEIYTLGGIPYPGMDGFEVVRKLEDGYRMEQPDCCPDEMYIVMLECWHENPDLRPTFTAIFDKLDRLLSERSCEYVTELELDERLSQTTESTTYGCESNNDGSTKPHTVSADVESVRYGSLQAFGWNHVPRVTVECVDNIQQVINTSQF